MYDFVSRILERITHYLSLGLDQLIIWADAAINWVTNKIGDFIDSIDLDIVIRELNLEGQYDSRRKTVSLSGRIDIDAIFFGSVYNFNKDFNLVLRLDSEGNSLGDLLATTLDGELQQQSATSNGEVFEKARDLNSQAEEKIEELNVQKAEFDDLANEINDELKPEIDNAEAKLVEDIPAIMEIQKEEGHIRRSSCENMHKNILFLDNLNNYMLRNGDNHVPGLKNVTTMLHESVYKRNYRNTIEATHEKVIGNVIWDMVNNMKHTGINGQNYARSQVLTNLIKKDMMMLLDGQGQTKRIKNHDNIAQKIQELRTEILQCNRA